ncbi:MAG TPA: efflux RND transporter permease subunit, partial [Rudaea sp.]
MSDDTLPSGAQLRTPSLINRLVATALEQRFLIVLLALILAGAGWWSLERLPMDAYPDLSPPMVEVITQWPG